MIIKRFYLIFALFVAGFAIAQEVAIREDHPDEYTVVRGDTLWDISGRFLVHPWQWPAIWQANPQIENPHLIYPGDRLSLVYVDGLPQLRVDRDGRTVKLSPGARTEAEPVNAIPLSAIQGFLGNRRILSASEFEGLPYVIANYEQRILGVEPTRTYVRGLSGNPGEAFVIMRLNNVFYGNEGDVKRARLNRPRYVGHTVPTDLRPPSPWGWTQGIDGDHKDVVGYELVEVGRGELLRGGDPATVELIAGRNEIKEGDFVLPVDDFAYDAQFIPRAMEQMPDNLRILALQDEMTLVGDHRVVAINGGARHGIETGHVFAAFRPPVTMHDQVKYPKGSWAAAVERHDDKVELPAELDGHIMVFRVFDRVSYALVMSSERPLKEDDILRHPDEVL